MGRRKVTLKEMQSLAGLSNSACSIIVPGHAFLCGLIDVTIGIKSPFHYIRLKKEAKAHLKIRGIFLPSLMVNPFFFRTDGIIQSI